MVTEQELRQDENRFGGPTPLVVDVIEVQCRGVNSLQKSYQATGLAAFIQTIKSRGNCHAGRHD
jgi:hypothetical protein